MILIRHGETPFNVAFGATRVDPGIPDPPLTERGRAQAREAAARLAELAIDRLIVSPYARALETADIIAGMLNLPVAVEPMVRERYAYSCDVGSPRSVLAREWGRFDFDHLDEQWWPPHEEPEPAFHGRCADFRRVMAEAEDWDRVLVVTHWGVVRSLTGERIGNGEMLRCDPTSEARATVPVVTPIDP